MARITHEDVFGFGQTPADDRFDPVFSHPVRGAEAGATFLVGDEIGLLFHANWRNDFGSSPPGNRMPILP